MSSRPGPMAPLAGACLLCSSLLSSPLAAEPRQAVALRDVVVTSTHTERTLQDAPATITVIHRDELESRPVQDLEDALRGTPGVQFSGVGMLRRGISLRGMSSEHTLILVDGQRINSSASAIAHADFDLAWIPMEAVERIEVVRGPMSSLYGSEALGGVVNVITRRATDQWRGSGAISGGWRDDGNGGQTQQYAAYLGGPLVAERLALSLSAERRQQQATADADNRAVSELDGRHADNAALTLTWTPDIRQRLDLTYRNGREKRWYNTNAAAASAAPRYYEFSDVIKREHWSLRHEGDWQWGSSSLSLYRNQLQRHNARTQGETASAAQQLTDTQLDGHLSLPLWQRHRLTFGGQWRKEQLQDHSVNSAGREQGLHRALFLQDEVDLWRDWSLTLGGRFDEHEAFGWQSSPRLYLNYRHDQALSFRGGVGRGFKAPTLKQLSPGYTATGGGGRNRFTIRGNPDLDPETNTTYEVAMSYMLDHASLDLSVFQNDVENLIKTTCQNSACSERTYSNVDKARIRGVELSTGLDLPADLHWEFNYSYLDALNRTEGQRLGDSSRHSGNNALLWQPKVGFQARLRHEYIGSQTRYSNGAALDLPAYSLWHLELSQSLGNNLRLRAGVENLGDKRMADLSDDFFYAEPGRVLHVGLNASF